MPLARTALYAKKGQGGIIAVEDMQLSTGNRYFVSSGGGGSTTSAWGDSPDAPLTTIDSGINRTTASKFDIVNVMPGHAETITAANAIDLDTIGTWIRGLGRGTLKPTVTFGTNATARIRVNAADCTISGLRLGGDINNLDEFINVNAVNCTIEDCDFVTSSAKEAYCFIQLATTAADGFRCRRCRVFQPTDPEGTDGGDATGFLYFEDVENILVEDCEFNGNFETAIFHNKTTAAKYFYVKNCHGIQELSGAEPFQLATACSGAMLGGGFITPAEAAATEATLVGTLGNGFFILPPGNFGNDGVSGGQGGIIVATAS